jgi:hypothetical protein
MPKTLFDFIQPKIESVVYCHQWRQNVSLKRCLEKCGSNQCLDIDQIVLLQKKLVKYS